MTTSRLLPFFFLCASHVSAQIPPELQPRAVRGDGRTYELQQALHELEKQTGNRVEDRRRAKDKIDVKLEDGTFWPVLESIARQAGCSISLHHPDAPVGLASAEMRERPSHVEGIFRFAVNKVAVAYDFQTGRRFAHITLEVAWEPRFHAFYFAFEPVEVEYADGGIKKTEKVAGQSQILVAGSKSREIDLRFPAPAREVLKLDRLQGTIQVLGASKMLDFTFVDLTSPKIEKTVEGVHVEVKLKKQLDLTEAIVKITNPAGGPTLDSFQAGTWLYYNRLAMWKREPGKTSTLQPHPNPLEDVSNSRKATIEYQFSNSYGTLLGWELRYTTPARLVEVPATFKIEGIALP